MTIAGLDEAALGPSLGPFCACLTRFELKDSCDETADIASLLRPAVLPPETPVKDQDSLRVGDSKVIYSPDKGLKNLEEAVLAFLGATGIDIPCNFRAFVGRLAGKDDLGLLDRTGWLAEASDLAIPVAQESDPEASESRERRIAALTSRMKEAGLSFPPPVLRFIPAKEFNRRIDIHGGKSGAIRSLLSPLMKAALNAGAGPGRFTVDRQGGRRYYGEWLVELFPGSPLRCVEEGRQRSAYRLGENTVEFMVKADAARMEVALASMFAKYARELAMILFNRWWMGKVPGLRPTAGYPQDARRFIADLEAAGVLPVDRDELIRRL